MIGALGSTPASGNWEAQRMSLRDTLMRWLDRGHVHVDPDEWVEVAVVPLSQGPLLVEQLRAAGIDATGADTFNVVTQVPSDFQVLVQRRDLADAERVLTPEPDDR